LNILIAITNGDRGGAQEHLRLIAEGLKHRGHTVAVLVQQPSDLAGLLADVGVTTVRWRHITRAPHPVRDLRARAELGRLVRKVRPDVLHVQSAKAGVLGRGLLKPPRGVTVFTCHHASFGPGRKWSHRLIGRPVEQLSLPLVDGVISDGARDMPMLRKLAPRTPVYLVRNAVPPVVDTWTDHDPPPHTAVWVARMAHPKDPIQAVHAWRHVVAAVPDARLVMCGTGPLADRLRKEIEHSPVRASIDYRGRVPSVAEVLAEGSVFLLATQVEGGCTMATLEAMSAGLVPVISDAGDAFLYTHSGSGEVVARNSPRALAAAVVGLFRDHERLRTMRRRAAQFAREDWTVDDMVDATVDVYRSVLHRSNCAGRD